MSSSEEFKGPPIIIFESTPPPLTLPPLDGPPLMPSYLYPLNIKLRHAKEARQQKREDDRIVRMLANDEKKAYEAYRYSEDPDYHSTKKNPMGPSSRNLPPLTKQPKKPKGGKPKGPPIKYKR